MVMQIKGKFIKNAALDSSKILLTAGQALRILAQDGSEKRLIELSAEGKVLVNGSEVALESSVLSRINSVTSSLAAEVAARQVADANLAADIATEASARAAAVSTEQARAMAAEALKLNKAGDTMTGDLILAATPGMPGSGSQWELSSTLISHWNGVFSAEDDVQKIVIATADGLAPSHTPSSTNIDFSKTYIEFVSGLKRYASFVAPGSYSLSADSNSLYSHVAGTEGQLGHLAIQFGGSSFNEYAADATFLRIGFHYSPYGSGAQARLSGLMAVNFYDRANPALNWFSSMPPESGPQVVGSTTTVAGTPGTASLLKFVQPDGANHIALKAPDSIASSVTLTLPANAGSLNQVLVTNGSGILSWSSVVDSEASARQAADAALQSALNAEISARQAADIVLQSNIDSEIAARSAAVSSEASARASADSALSARLDIVEGSGEGSVAKAESDAKAYADQKIADLVNSAPAVLDTLKELSDALGGDENFAATVAGQIGDVQDNVDAEEARALAAEQTLQANITAEETARIAAVSAEKTRAEAAEAALSAAISAESAARSSAVSSEAAARSAADAALQAEIDAEESARASADSALDARVSTLETNSATKTYVDGKVSELTSGINDLDGYAQDVRSDLDQEIIDRAAADLAEQTARIAAVSAEEAARTAADNALDSKINQKHAEALSYADSKVAALVNSAPAVLDTLKELADALGGDANFSTTVASQIASASDNLGDRFMYEQFVVSAEMISAGYMELGFKGFAASMVVSNGRLMMFEGEDYSVSVVGGKSRLTFAGSMLPGQSEALEVGDVIKVKYLKDVR